MARLGWICRRAVLTTAVLLLTHGALAQQAEPSGASGSRRIDVRAAHKAACATAYESAQEAKVENRLREARQQLAICAEAQCPEFIRADCARWFEEVEQSLPSVVISGRAADGAETINVKVSIDGRVVTPQLDGKALTLDPGEHTFRFEHPGEAPIERTVLIREGERNRPIEASWFTGEGAPSAAGASGEPGPLRPYSYVLGGVAGAGLISFGVFGILGRQQEQSVTEKCDADLTTCPTDEIDQAEQKLLIADISLVVAAVSLITGTTFFVLSEPSDESKGEVRLDLGVHRGGGMATLRGTF